MNFSEIREGTVVSCECEDGSFFEACFPHDDSVVIYSEVGPFIEDTDSKNCFGNFLDKCWERKVVDLSWDGADSNSIVAHALNCEIPEQRAGCSPVKGVQLEYLGELFGDSRVVDFAAYDKKVQDLTMDLVVDDLRKSVEDSGRNKAPEGQDRASGEER